MNSKMNSLFITITLLLILSGELVHADAITTNVSHDGSLSATQQSIADSVLTEMKFAFNNKVNLTNCNKNPAYTCNGLMVSAFEHSDLYWTNSNPPHGKFSMTYFRSDIIGGLYGDSGYILWPEKMLDKIIGVTGRGTKHFQSIYRCEFAINAITDSRVDNGCGRRNDESEYTPSPNSSPCQSQGYYTAEDIINNYWVPKKAFCGFALNLSAEMDKYVFDQSIAVQKHIIQEIQGYKLWNEIILKPWPNTAAEHIPLMAFFHVATGSIEKLVLPKGYRHEANGALELAQSQQYAYYKLTGIFAPIIEISGDRNGVTFTFNRNEQSSNIPDIVNAFPE